MIRRADENDADGLARIYNQALEMGVDASHENAPVDRENRRRWLSEHNDLYPAFVHQETSGEITGWSALNRLTIRPLLSRVAEVSVYVERSHQSKFVGVRLLLHLMEVAENLGFHSLVAMSFASNLSSMRLGLAVGFREAAVLTDVALLQDRWESDVWLQKDLRPGWKVGVPEAMLVRFGADLGV